jgi:hypothetical protein
MYQISLKPVYYEPSSSMRTDGRADVRAGGRTDGETDRQRDTTKLTVAFRNSVNVSKNTT